MKVLFAVNNESISESIIKQYQQEYKEIISSKNVYYFDAIVRELQKDKTYDRIVISEDVEPFTNNNYGVIDNFIFKRLDNISDEATTTTGQDIPIILICADRRTKSENFFVKLFGIGIYSALIGQDRTTTNVCKLINTPRSKKDAKIYYRIDSDEVDYKSENDGDVNEVEIQNILNHYKRLGKNEEEYVKSFDNIAEQYTDAQLRVICRFLPLNVKAVLEANSQKYQELITFGTATPSRSQRREKENKYVPNKDYHDRKNGKKEEKKLDVLEKNIGKSELTKPVVIPKVAGSGKEFISEDMNQDQAMQNVMREQQIIGNMGNNMAGQINKANNDIDMNEIDDILNSVEADISEQTNTTEKKKRGRPRKVKEPEEVNATEAPKRKRGRPKKIKEPEENQEEVNLFELGDNTKQEDVNLFDLGDDNKNDGEIILPGLDENTDNQVTNAPAAPQNLSNQETSYMPEFSYGQNNFNQNQYTNNQAQYNQAQYNQGMFDANSNSTRAIETPEQYMNQNDANLKNLLSMSNKLVAFVGTSKNGTSFLVNSMAEILSRRGINTAILDLTQNKNAYYIYTKNDEELRKTAFSCIDNLQEGIDKGIEVNKNLTVFTTLPDRNTDYSKYQEILTTLMKNYSLVIMDCDYDTNYAYFNFAQEIYLVQSYDILTIQPLTAFLRNLKSRNILDPNKLRIVINKALRVRTITDKVIIGGMSSYNDPSMSYMTELFNKDTIQYCTIPFDQETYSKYLDGLVNCEITTRGYPKNILESLDVLANMMYPLLNNDKPANKYGTYTPRTSGFSSNINATLNRMKSRY